MRIPGLFVALSLSVAACGSDGEPPVVTDDTVITVEPGGDVFVEDIAAADDPVLADGRPEAVPGAASTAAPAPVAPPSADASVPVDEVPPLRGAAVCEALVPALSSYRLNATDVGLYATQPVIDVLRENTGFRPEGGLDPDELDAWVDDGVTTECNLSAGGDAWYVITLSARGEGQLATGIRMTTSYGEGGP